MIWPFLFKCARSSCFSLENAFLFCITIGSRVDDLVRKRQEDDDEILSFLLSALDLLSSSP
jgi:hypothetical protein